MPELCRFYGIIIKMYFGDHAPPHFHAEYSGHRAVINIITLALIEGKLPLVLWGWLRNGHHFIKMNYWRHGIVLKNSNLRVK